MILNQQQKWYYQRIDEDEGEIYYEAHQIDGDGFVVFRGSNAINDCQRFIEVFNCD